MITEDAVKPIPDFLKSILEFPVPKDLTGVRSWFGLVNQVSYAYSVASLMEPFRHLLDKIFQLSKEKITRAVESGVKMFDVKRETSLSTVWSRTGMEFSLTQKWCKCCQVKANCCPGGWRIAFAGSRFTTTAESQYHPVEGEALAVAWALHKTKYFTLGNDSLMACVDHKPLVKILGDRGLGDIDNTRILNFKEKTLRWRFKVEHVNGKLLKLADVMSRYPVTKPVQDDKHLRPWEPKKSRKIDCRKQSSEVNTEAVELALVAAVSRTVNRAVGAEVNALTEQKMIDIKRISEESHRDPEVKRLKDLVQGGLPGDCTEWPDQIRDYYLKGAEYMVV